MEPEVVPVRVYQEIKIKMSDFKGDLNIGEIGVELARKVLKNRGFLTRKGKNGYFPNFDLEVKRADNPGISKVEVKFDLSSAVTGNIAVEHKALQKSAASHYIYLVVTPYIIKKENLEWCVSSPDFKQVKSGDFGDISSLIPVSYLELSHFKKL